MLLASRKTLMAAQRRTFSMAALITLPPSGLKSVGCGEDCDAEK
jgi:hypothetical protein